MRGLTTLEAEMLRDMTAPGDQLLSGDEQREVLDRLIEQGRAAVRVEQWRDAKYEYTQTVWSITTQGREALRLFEKLRGES